ncbi:class I SAM-dependent methyltransferase [Winogradskyella litorisediminis]|uniref:Class I SAM-dependent methyltransferase n=1 Tax=Winogradskyella litorisediminis TaxID=1156618 RepID=A0ABW3NB51_9FLAO
MRLSRNITNRINWIFDNLIPPLLRDSKAFMAPFFYLLFKKDYKKFMTFKSKASQFSVEEMQNFYKTTEDLHIKRETDLNTKSIKFILNNLKGKTILDISCGRGYLVKKIAEDKSLIVTGVDFNIPDFLENSENINYVEATIEAIPFDDNSFDTVICTHTIEHIVNINLALKELKRVCKKRLIIVVPRQKNYKYTFDLHVNFFPYKHTVLDTFGHDGKVSCLQNDWLYINDNIN